MVELAHWSFFVYSPLAHRDIVHRRHGCMPAANYYMELAQLARSVPSHHPPTILLYGFYRPDHSTPTTLHHGFCQPNLQVTLASTHEPPPPPSFSDPPSLTSQAPSKPSPQSIHALGSLKPSGPALCCTQPGISIFLFPNPQFGLCTASDADPFAADVGRRQRRLFALERQRPRMVAIGCGPARRYYPVVGERLEDEARPVGHQSEL
ncbi:hypothetical protein IWZ01DRAFT_525495 [Phyllosticta capitalensis]